MDLGRRELSAGEEVINKHLYYALHKHKRTRLDVLGTDISTKQKSHNTFLKYMSFHQLKCV